MKPLSERRHTRAQTLLVAASLAQDNLRELVGLLQKELGCKIDLSRDLGRLDVETLRKGRRNENTFSMGS